MMRELTCIRCPRSCELELALEDGKVISVGNAGCVRGEEYAIEEYVSPQRNFATSLLVRGGEEPLVSVRLTGNIPRDSIKKALSLLTLIVLDAPVYPGQVVATDILGLGVDAIATRKVAPASKTASLVREFGASFEPRRTIQEVSHARP